MAITDKAFRWESRYVPETGGRVQCVGIECKKCHNDEWHPAPTPGWGRRIFKNKGWNVGNGSNAHTCPACIAARKSKKLGASVAPTPAPAPPPAPPPPVHVEVPEPTPIVETPVVNTAMAEALAPLKAEIEKKAKTIKARGQSFGFSSEGNARWAAKQLLISKMRVVNPVQDTHFRIDKDPDGTFRYTLIGTTETADPISVVFKTGAGRRLSMPGERISSTTHARASAVRALTRLGVLEPKEGVHYLVRKLADNRAIYELLWKPDPTQKAALPQAAKVGGYRSTPNPPGRLFNRRDNTRRAAAAWLKRLGIENAKEGVHFRIHDKMGGWSYSVTAETPEDSRVSGPVKIIKPVASYLSSFDARKGARKALEAKDRTYQDRAVTEGVDYWLFTDANNWWGYRLTPPEDATPPAAEPQTTAPTLYEASVAYEEPPVSDSSTQAVSDLEGLPAVDATSVIAAIRQPTRADNRRIMEALDESYDTERQRYLRAITDSSVATSLGVPRAWVSDLRDKLYGPDVNEAATALREQQVKALTAAVAVADKAIQVAEAIIAQASELETMRSELKSALAEAKK